MIRVSALLALAAVLFAICVFIRPAYEGTANGIHFGKPEMRNIRIVYRKDE